MTIGFQQNGAGLFVPERPSKRERYPLPIAIDLFCGAGGMSLGVHQAGFHVIAASDNDPIAAITYTVNLGAYPMQFHYLEEADRERLEKALERELFGRTRKTKTGLHVSKEAKEGSKWELAGEEAFRSGSGWISHYGCLEDEHAGIGYDGKYNQYLAEVNRAPVHPYGVEHFFLGDVRKLSGRDILDALELEPGEVDLVFGGPPCQGFSHVGKRQVMDPRNSLVFEFARLVLEIRPRTMMMENVPAIASMTTPEGLPIIDALCRILEDGDFGPYDSLRQSLLASSGAGAALRGKPVAKERRRAKPRRKGRRQEGSEQEALAV